MKELTSEIVGSFIQQIDVWHTEKQRKARRQKLPIHFNCVGSLELPEHKDMPKTQIKMDIRRSSRKLLHSYSV